MHVQLFSYYPYHDALSIDLLRNESMIFASTKVHMLNCYRCEVNAKKLISRQLLSRPSKFTPLRKNQRYPVVAGIMTFHCIDWRKNISKDDYAGT